MEIVIIESIMLIGLLFSLLADHVGDVGEEGRAAEDEHRAEPVAQRERILKVPDADEQRRELAERHHQRHSQRRTLGSQHEDGVNARRSAT